MLGNQVPDKTLMRQVNQRLSRASTGSRSRIVVTIKRGDVTLSGFIRYENQRRPAIRAVTAVAGVRRVIDQLKVEAMKR